MSLYDIILPQLRHLSKHDRSYIVLRGFEVFCGFGKTHFILIFNDFSRKEPITKHRGLKFKTNSTQAKIVGLIYDIHFLTNKLKINDGQGKQSFRNCLRFN